MRYYTLIISDPDGSNVLNLLGSTFTSQTVPGVDGSVSLSSLSSLGQSLRGALNVELDIPVVPYAVPMGAAFVRVWGISITSISQSSNLNGKLIKVFAGMAKGLPLANPQQAGLIMEGTIQQAFGNWEGVNQTLDMIVQPATGLPATPLNLTMPWNKGQPLSEAISNTIAVAFPDYALQINISDKLVLPADEPGYFQTLSQFAQQIKLTSQRIIGGDYAGVDIVIKEKKFVIYDGTTQTTPKQIAFTDLIGQPTWINAGQIMSKCVMRADINLGDFVKLPPGQIVTTPQSYSQYRNGSTFQGTYQVDQVRHVGNFRHGSGEAWITTLTMHLAPPQTSATTGSGAPVAFGGA